MWLQEVIGGYNGLQRVTRGNRGLNPDNRVNPDNSRATSALTFLLFKLNTLHKETLH